MFKKYYYWINEKSLGILEIDDRKKLLQLILISSKLRKKFKLRVS